MALLIGRQSSAGLAVEATPGTPEASPSVFIPFTENTLQEKHEPLMDISSRASRVKDHDAVAGKKWGEGDLAVYVDATNIGYLFKTALGNEVKTVVGGTPEVNDHQFYPTTSGNTPKSATLWDMRGSGPSVKKHAFSCIDTLEFEVTNEDIATATSSFITGFPTEVTAPTLATTSGTLLTWKDTTVKFGDNIVDAESQTATKLTNLKLTIANNVEAIYRSGDNEPDTFIVGEAEITGEYTVFLEGDTEINAYRNLTKRAMLIDLIGANIGTGGYTERVRMNIHRMIIEDEAVETELDGVLAITQSFRLIQGTEENPGYFDVIIRNLKTSVY